MRSKNISAAGNFKEGVMRILLVEPGKKPEVKEINGELHTMQELVGGTIQAIYPFEEPVALVCNDEGKLLGLPMNRALYDEEEQLYDIISGTFFLCGAPPDCDHFTSLTREQVEKYQRKFAVPEMFLRVNGEIVILPII